MKTAITEKFLSFIWKSKLFDSNITVNSEKVEILHLGEINNDAGPDFTNSKIKIGETIWAGNVEIHVKSSDWFTHNHHKNGLFDNVILHVVWKKDTEVYTSKGRQVLTIELKYDNYIWEKFETIVQSSARIPCEKELCNVNQITIISWLNTLTAELLQRKIDIMSSDLEHIISDWDEIFYRQLLRNFGFHVNSEPFSILAKSLPYKILEKHSNNIIQIEALLFGQAGFLLDDYSTDNYFLTLKHEYEFLKAKYNLKPVDVHLWKFMRLRPANFPSIRIAQFAGMVYAHRSLLTKCLKSNSITELQKIFTNQVSDYWETHYYFGTPSKKHKAVLGTDSINIIIINTIVPFYFLYGKKLSDNSLCNKSLTFLENIPPEKNSEINIWKANGMNPKSAFDTQALLFLKKDYCQKKRCIECRIGANILLKDNAN